MKKLLTISAIALLSAPAFAEDASSIPGEFSGSVALTSDYTSRGLVQSDENPAIQGGLTYTVPLDDNFSVYAGAWASSVDFNDSSEATIEIDWLAGVGYTVDKFSLDTGIIYYQYPGADHDLNYEYYELQASVGYDLDPFYVRTGVNYTPDNAAKSGVAVYLKAAVEYKPMDDLKLTLRGGRQYIEHNANFGVPDYYDWGLGATYTFKGVDFTAEYVQNDIEKASCNLSCDGKVLFTVGKSF